MIRDKTIKVGYYAILREQRGCSEETLTTDAATPHDLYERIASNHGFSLRRDQLKVVVNDNFSSWETKLKDGDAVVFIPPVAGG